MLLINISKPILENNEVHTRTIINLSEKNNFTTILIENDSDIDLASQSFDISLVPGKKYYIRARYYFTPGGLQGWSEPFMFIAKDNNILDIEVTPPIPAIPPTMSVKYFDLFNTPLKAFKVLLSYDQDIIKHIKYVNWLIEDIDGKVIFSSLKDTNNMHGLLVPKFLKINTVYTIKVQIVTITNNSSTYISLPIKTFDIGNDFYVINDSIKYNLVGIIREFTIKTPIDFSEYVIESYDINSNLLNTIVGTNNNIILDGLLSDDTILIRIKGIINGVDTGWLYIHNNYGMDIGFEYSFPFQLG